MTHDVHSIPMWNHFTYIIDTFSENQLLWEELVAFVVKRKQSDIICAIFKDYEVIRVHLGHRLNLIIVFLD